MIPKLLRRCPINCHAISFIWRLLTGRSVDDHGTGLTKYEVLGEHLSRVYTNVVGYYVRIRFFAGGYDQVINGDLGKVSDKSKQD